MARRNRNDQSPLIQNDILFENDETVMLLEKEVKSNNLSLSMTFQFVEIKESNFFINF